MIAYIGIGANLGDARGNVLDALARLARMDGGMLLHTSSMYRTAPIDSSGDDYINAVACLDTSLGAHELLAALQGSKTQIHVAGEAEAPARKPAPRR